jgi:hypothetical protein
VGHFERIRREVLGAVAEFQPVEERVAVHVEAARLEPDRACVVDHDVRAGVRGRGVVHRRDAQRIERHLAAECGAGGAGGVAGVGHLEGELDVANEIGGRGEGVHAVRGRGRERAVDGAYVEDEFLVRRLEVAHQLAEVNLRDGVLGGGRPAVHSRRRVVKLLHRVGQQRAPLELLETRPDGCQQPCQRWDRAGGAVGGPGLDSPADVPAHNSNSRGRAVPVPARP